MRECEWCNKTEDATPEMGPVEDQPDIRMRTHAECADRCIEEMNGEEL